MRVAIPIPKTRLEAGYFATVKVTVDLLRTQVKRLVLLCPYMDASMVDVRKLVIAGKVCLEGDFSGLLFNMSTPPLAVDFPRVEGAYDIELSMVNVCGCAVIVTGYFDVESAKLRTL